MQLAPTSAYSTSIAVATLLTACVILLRPSCHIAVVIYIDHACWGFISWFCMSGATDGYGQTALHLAAMQRAMPTALLLLEKSGQLVRTAVWVHW